MDLTPIVLGVAAINLGVFLAGCALATYRTWRELPTRRRAQARARALGAHDFGVSTVGQPTR